MILIDSDQSAQDDPGAKLSVVEERDTAAMPLERVLSEGRRAYEVALSERSDGPDPLDPAGLEGFTRRQALFVLEYLVDFNATAAARRAGYSPNGSDAHHFQQGLRLLRHPRVGAEIRRRAELSAEELGISRAYVLTRLQTITERASEKGDLYTATRGYELLAKLRGDMIERRQVDVRTVAITINDVEMEDLR